MLRALKGFVRYCMSDIFIMERLLNMNPKMQLTHWLGRLQYTDYEIYRRIK